MSIPLGYVKIPTDKVGLGFLRLLKEELTVVGESTSSFKKEDVVHHLWVETKEFIGVPRWYYLARLKHRAVEAVADFSSGSPWLKHDRNFELRDGQSEIINSAVEACSKYGYGGCVVEAGVGSGKTIMLMEIARLLGLKPLILLPREILLLQWAEEIKKFYPKWRIGRLQGDIIEVRGYDVVVGTIQSAALKDDYEEWVYKEFGTVIIDECHIASAKEFSKGIPKFSAKYVIGGSGTVSRADKCEKVFAYMAGEKLAFLNKVTTMTPQIYFIDTGFAWKGWQAPLDRQRVKYLSKLVLDPKRNLMIVRQAVKAAKAGRNVLILSERVDHVRELVDKIRIELADSGITVGEMVGKTSAADRDLAKNANIIGATIQLVGTGFNEPRLDTLIFATPAQNVEQAIGRVTRLHPDKKQPLVLDLVDTHSETGMIFAKSRFKKYMLKNYKLFGTQCFPKEFLWKYQKELQHQQSTGVVLRSKV